MSLSNRKMCAHSATNAIQAEYRTWDNFPFYVVPAGTPIGTIVEVWADGRSYFDRFVLIGNEPDGNGKEITVALKEKDGSLHGSRQTKRLTYGDWSSGTTKDRERWGVEGVVFFTPDQVSGQIDRKKDFYEHSYKYSYEKFFKEEIKEEIDEEGEWTGQYIESATGLVFEDIVDVYREWCRRNEESEDEESN